MRIQKFNKVLLSNNKKRIRAHQSSLDEPTNRMTNEPSNIPKLMNELKTLTINPNKKIKKVFLKL